MTTHLGSGNAVLLAAHLATRFRHSRRENVEIRLSSEQPTAIPLKVSGDLTFAELLLAVHEGLASGPRTAPTGDDGSVERVLFDWADEESAPPSGPDDDWNARFLTLLDDAVRRPNARIDELVLLSERQRAEIAAAANAHREDYRDLLPLHEAFERSARRDPDGVAVLAGGVATTYGEIDARADVLANALAGAGVGAESLVGVCVERSADLVVALLAVLKRGAAFVPLDPALPPARIAVIAQDARAAAVLVQESKDPLASVGVPLIPVTAEGAGVGVPRTAAVSLDHAAYVYYTSGSTGTPKGTVIDHRCAATRLEWLGRRYGLQPGDRVVHKTPLIFDVAIWEIFGPLSAGATILMADPGAESDVMHINDLLSTERTVFVHFVPSMLNAYLNLAPVADFPDLRWVQLSGEAAGTHLLERFAKHFTAELHNLYGQTETSEVAGWEGRSYDGRGGLPLGRQIGVYRLFVLDDALRPVPPGVPGELCVSGAGGLSRGYLRRPALTAERFVPHPYPIAPGERLYRTGDLVTVDGAGDIHFLGRVDGQVKIRGSRVETGEVEAVLADHPGVRECAVTVFQDEDGENQLAAYVVGDAWEVAALAAAVETRLPSYMLPAVYMALDELPHTPSGKLDRLRLPAPSLDDRQARTGDDAPRTPIEEQLAALWLEVLGVERIGRADSFFAVGGNSLKSLQLLNRVNAAFQVQVSVRDFFAEPTVEGLARGVEKALTAFVANLSEDEAAALLGQL